MALGALPTLTEINTELGTTGQSLSTCIANAGKTGVWDRQSDFAFYSASTLFYETTDSASSGGADIAIYKYTASKTTTITRIELKAKVSMTNYVLDMFKAAFSDFEQVATTGQTLISSRTPVKRVTGNNFVAENWLSIDINIAITVGETLSFAVYDGGATIPNKASTNFYQNNAIGNLHFSDASGQLATLGTGEMLIKMYE